MTRNTSRSPDRIFLLSRRRAQPLGRHDGAGELPGGRDDGPRIHSGGRRPLPSAADSRDQAALPPGLAPASTIGVMAIADDRYQTSRGGVRSDPLPLRRILEPCVALLAAVGAAFLIVGWTPVANLVAMPLLKVPSNPVKADVAVVLAGGRYQDGSLNEAAIVRTIAGVRLYHQGLVPRLLFSGGSSAVGDLPRRAVHPHLRERALLGRVPPEGRLAVRDPRHEPAPPAEGATRLRRLRGCRRAGARLREGPDARLGDPRANRPPGGSDPRIPGAGVLSPERLDMTESVA